MAFDRTLILIACAALQASAPALAQSVAAQRRYEQQIAICNSGNLARPERDACVRDAGIALDQARASGGSRFADETSPDGRSTVVIQNGAPPPADDSDTVTSPDGRATIVLPAGGSMPDPQ
ncbi:hypothetical protein QTI66_04665 [Variovorax sp. J22R133]|uniref:hypothetical protein n=1 Tax=Variovorax brevis TaxID=3053503 RepID=UPI00257491D1|nr:hypothetical protein [Variovorax sp. J22R133]MDM0111429.1 hypothetical protein [Variovorax sp. J22R133]